MKKIIRGLIKIPLTPIVVLFCIFMLVGYYIILFVEWLYDSSDSDKQITKECIYVEFKVLKDWFTTI